MYDCRSGSILVFQYNGGDNFWAHVMSSGIEDDGGSNIVNTNSLFTFIM